MIRCPQKQVTYLFNHDDTIERNYKESIFSMAYLTKWQFRVKGNSEILNFADMIILTGIEFVMGTGFTHYWLSRICTN